MSTGEMQACLARLYVDEPFRNLFFMDAGTALRAYRLTADELASLTDLDHEQLESFAESLVAKRRKRVERAFPLLFSLDPVEIRRYYARFHQLYHAKPYQPSQQDALDFGAFVEESLAKADHLPPYASDLARYERLYFSTRLALAAKVYEVPEHAQPQVRVINMGERPSLVADVTVADFAYDMGLIEEALQNGREPEGAALTGGGCSIVFRPSMGPSGVQMLRINAPTKAILERCDGRRAVSEIVANIETALGATDLGERIAESIHRLMAAGVLTLRAPARSLAGMCGGAADVESL